MANMAKQMDLFALGGLKDEGGEIDEASGNRVPIGGTKEGVRDDIPANVSEGEFVFPADVVRYHGLDKMMALRQEAKMGLRKMESMGQMGNSEEATMSDDMPFDMADLIVVGGQGEPMQFAEGGFVPQTETLQTAAVPTMGGPTGNVTPIVYDDFAKAPVVTMQEYRNAAGETIIITSVNGKATTEIPAGYTLYTPPTNVAPSGVQAVIQTANNYSYQTSGGGEGPDTPRELQVDPDYASMDNDTYFSTMERQNSFGGKAGNAAAMGIALAMGPLGLLTIGMLQADKKRQLTSAEQRIASETNPTKKKAYQATFTNMGGKTKEPEEENALVEFGKGFLTAVGGLFGFGNDEVETVARTAGSAAADNTNVVSTAPERSLRPQLRPVEQSGASDQATTDEGFLTPNQSDAMQTRDQAQIALDKLEQKKLYDKASAFLREYEYDERRARRNETGKGLGDSIDSPAIEALLRSPDTDFTGGSVAQPSPLSSYENNPDASAPVDPVAPNRITANQGGRARPKPGESIPEVAQQTQRALNTPFDINNNIISTKAQFDEQQDYYKNSPLGFSTEFRKDLFNSTPNEYFSGSKGKGSMLGADYPPSTFKAYQAGDDPRTFNKPSYTTEYDDQAQTDAALLNPNVLRDMVAGAPVRNTPFDTNQPSVRTAGLGDYIPDFLSRAATERVAPTLNQGAIQAQAILQRQAKEDAEPEISPYPTILRADPVGEEVAPQSFSDSGVSNSLQKDFQAQRKASQNAQTRYPPAPVPAPAITKPAVQVEGMGSPLSPVAEPRETINLDPMNELTMSVDPRDSIDGSASSGIAGTQISDSQLTQGRARNVMPDPYANALTSAFGGRNVKDQTANAFSTAAGTVGGYDEVGTIIDKLNIIDGVTPTSTTVADEAALVAQENARLKAKPYSKRTESLAAKRTSKGTGTRKAAPTGDDRLSQANFLERALGITPAKVGARRGNDGVLYRTQADKREADKRQEDAKVRERNSARAVARRDGKLDAFNKKYAKDIEKRHGGEKEDTKIVCTEMYRQTQLVDWQHTMKIWHVYQEKHLTPYHQVGYHWLFKPYVRGMKNSSILTKLGAALAKHRTEHLRYILTKGKAKDNLIGNVWCKFVHPLVYIAGIIKEKIGK